MTPPVVTVVGDALLDVVAMPAGPVRGGADVPAAIQMSAGGQGANLAVRLARRGVAARLVCALADDAAGRVVRDALEAEGVEIRPVSAAATGSVVIVVTADAERTMLSQRAPLGASLPALPRAEWLMVSGYLLLEPGAEALARDLRGRAARRVLVGCAVPAEAMGSWRAAVAALAPDLVVANREEVLALALDRDGLVTTDRSGATARVAGVQVSVSTPSGPPAVDTTGAGDAFAATLVAQLFGSWPPGAAALERAMASAATDAAAVTRVPGAQGRIDGERTARLST